MLSACIGLALLVPVQQVVVLPEYHGQKARLEYSTEPLQKPRLDPKNNWEFLYRISVICNDELRFRVYAPGAATVKTAVDAATTCGRLWQLAKHTAGVDHPLRYDRLVELFLAEGGRAGGEQGVFEGVDETGQRKTRNTIYIYDIASYSDPVQKLRELAHEYGHAVLQPIGGFETPEEWGDGFFGERLFLRAFHQEGWLKSPSFDQWLRDNVTLLADKTWTEGVDFAKLAGKGPVAMNEYLGLMLFAAEAFPDALPRSLLLTGGQKATHALDGVMKALDDRNEWTVLVPDRLRGKDLHLPFSRAWSLEGCRILAWQGSWVKVRPSGERITAKRTSE